MKQKREIDDHLLFFSLVRFFCFLILHKIHPILDVTHTGMKRKIENPRIICLDCTLEYKKGESALEVQLERQGDFERLLEIEEEYIKRMCYDILKFKPDLVITEKGCSDLAQHFFVKNGVTALRRFKKTDNNRIARACGATIVNRPEDLQESFVGTKCGLFEVKKVFFFRRS